MNIGILWNTGTTENYLKLVILTILSHNFATVQWNPDIAIFDITIQSVPDIACVAGARKGKGERKSGARLFPI